MDNKYRVIKEKCSICGRTYKKIVTNTGIKSKLLSEYDGKNICASCERKYRIISGYSGRGYGYKYSTEATFTIMDRSSTPTYGVEIEVAGNISNIDKIARMTERANGYSECSIGYDTSVEGAQFELSYAPGTYYWYLYESNLKAVCALLEKDPWTIKDSPTIGMHIHVGNINLTDTKLNLENSINSDPIFWEILRIVSKRKYNQYCRPVFSRNHHDAISRSDRWRTIEFRTFAGTYNFNEIMTRIRFVRQLIDNTDKTGTHWNKFSDEIKEYILNLVESDTNTTDEVKEAIRKLFNGEIEKSGIDVPDYIPYWKERVDREYYGEEEYDEDEEEENEEDY